jgi:putative membrane protein
MKNSGRYDRFVERVHKVIPTSILFYFFLFFKGMATGIANLIPGVSGGTMAFLLGIYDRLTDSIGNFFLEIKNWAKTRERILFIAVFGTGSAVSFWLFTKVLDRLLGQDLTRQWTCLFFIGLILGSIPYIIKIHNDWKFKIRRGLLFLLALGGVIALALFSSSLRGGDAGSGFTTDVVMTPLYGIWVFIAGVLSAGSMILPGFSGSALLLSLGEYYNMVHYAGEIIDWVKAVILDGAPITSLSKTAATYMGCMFLGTPVGSIFISKLINYVLHKFPSETYYFILGLLVASVYQIFTEIQYTLDFSFVAVIVSLVCLSAGFIAAFGMSKIKKA